MKTITISTTQANSLLAKPFVSFPRFAKLVIQDAPHPEFSFVASAELVIRNGEFFMDGKLVTHEKRVASGERVFIIAEPASWRDALRVALESVSSQWQALARLGCAEQDEHFMRSVGMMQAN